jgi:hypothetical protein
VRQRAAPSFWEACNALDPEVRKLADKSFEILKHDPHHSPIRLKKTGRFWSARVGRHHRAFCVEIPDGLLWFWIGDHATYDRLVS